MRFSPTLAAVLLAGTAAIAQAETITVTLVNGHPPVLRWVKHLQESFVPAVDKALEGTGYTIRWRQQYSGTLARVGEELAALQDGIADIALVPTTFHVAELPLQSVGYYAPFISDDPALIVGAMEDLQRQVPAMAQAWEDNGAYYLGGAFAVDDYLLFTKFPIERLDDLQGRKIGAPGPTVSWLKGTGAVGVASNIPEYYNALQTGLFDGVMTFATAAVPAKIQEVAPYITAIKYGAQYTGGIAVNQDWYATQAQVVKDALLQGAQDYQAAYMADLRQAAQTALDTLLAQGGILNPQGDALRLAYAQTMENPSKSWLEDLGKQGLPAQEVLSIYMQAVRAAGAVPARDWDRD